MAFGHDNFFRDVIAKQLTDKEIYAYPIDTWCSSVDSLESYFKSSMALLNADVRRDLFGQSGRRIYTKIRNSAPTKYSEGAVVKNSLIADGCVIEGTVENSILFRGVRVGKGTVVRNSILLQDTVVGKDVQLNCAISDKNVVIRDGRMLSGHESMPFFIGKGLMV
jgi:glucose-1-phosphate adenylyltransferase